jgi:hypothetical protein
VQETHFKENDAKGMDTKAKFKSHNYTHDGDGKTETLKSIN